MKEHIEREMINALRDCALEFHKFQSLRERLSHIVKEYTKKDIQYKEKEVRLEHR